MPRSDLRATGEGDNDGLRLFFKWPNPAELPALPGVASSRYPPPPKPVPPASDTLGARAPTMA